MVEPGARGSMAWLRALRHQFGQRFFESALRWVALGVGIGVLCGLVAAAFFLALETATHLTFAVGAGVPMEPPPGDQIPGLPGVAAQSPRPWLFFVLPAIGGLLSGVLVYRFAPEAEGHGTDATIRAFHEQRGVIRARVPLVKGVATILTLCTGGSAGKEGPIAQIGGGVGSLLAQKMNLTVRDRRILLLAGVAGGLGAIFRAPLGSAITAIEVLYREDFESDALIPCVIASVSAYAVFVSLIGSTQTFDVPTFSLFAATDVVGYAILALVSAPVGRAYIWLFYGVRDRLFARLPVSRMLMPMIGGLGVGVLGLAVPQAYGPGWGWIQEAIDGRLSLSVLALALLAKILATSLTIGSGGSGGVFGPTLFIGAMLGGLVGYGGNAWAPQLFPQPQAYVLVGMASFFAGVASAPIGAMLMVAEMTGGYELLPALMLVSVLSIVLQHGHSIYKFQVRDRFNSPAHAAERVMNVLEELRVADVLQDTTAVVTVPLSSSFEVMRKALLDGKHSTVPVVDDTGSLAGLLTAEQLRQVMDDRQLEGFVVAGDICTPATSLYADDDLARAHQLFHTSGCAQIPVIRPGSHPVEFLGMLDYRSVMLAYETELRRRREA
jgi:chloride channel protein, CIC family